MRLNFSPSQTYGIYRGSIILLLLCNGFLLWKVSEARKVFRYGQPGARVEGVRSLVSHSVKSSTDKPIILNRVGAPYLVLFVFTGQDCPACLEELNDLQRLGQTRTDLRVFGLMSYASADELRQTQRNFQITFPLLEDEDGRLLRDLHPPATPWKILIWTTGNRIMYEDPPSTNPAQREAFFTRMMNLPRL